MTIESRRFDNAAEAIVFLEKLALGDGDYIFRGHADEAWKLKTSLRRHTSIPHESWNSDIDQMLDQFRVGLAKLGLLPFESDNRLDWLEFARHHGVPTPVLDFSNSPYVALFFAFNGIRYDRNKAPEYVAIYALDVNRLAWFWATLSFEPRNNYEEVMRRREGFLYPSNNPFEHGFPGDSLQFIPFPGKRTLRMQRQQGALLYDTLYLANLDAVALDDLIDRHTEPKEVLPTGEELDSPPTGYKVCISKACVSEVFSRLELMGINAGSLYLDANGVAADVVNSYNYNSKNSYLRDIGFPFPDDTKV